MMCGWMGVWKQGMEKEKKVLWWFSFTHKWEGEGDNV